MSACGASLASTFVLARENRRLRHQRDAHALRYDSLLAAKLRTDRLLVNAGKSGGARQPAASTGRVGVANQRLIRP